MATSAWQLDSIHKDLLAGKYLEDADLFHLWLCRTTEHLAKACWKLAFLPDLGKTVSHSLLIGCTSPIIHATNSIHLDHYRMRLAAVLYQSWSTFIVGCHISAITTAVLRADSHLQQVKMKVNTSHSLGLVLSCSDNLIMLCQSINFSCMLASKYPAAILQGKFYIMT